MKPEHRTGVLPVPHAAAVTHGVCKPAPASDLLHRLGGYIAAWWHEHLQHRDERQRLEALASLDSRLLQDIEASDAIVYIDLQFDTQSEGVTTLFASNDQCRFIRVVISRLASYSRRIEMLGHELHHALEIIRAPDVRVPTDVRRLYAQIGWLVSTASFESNGAIDTERQVRRELMAPALKR